MLADFILGGIGSNGLELCTLCVYKPKEKRSRLRVGEIYANPLSVLKRGIVYII